MKAFTRFILFFILLVTFIFSCKKSDNAIFKTDGSPNRSVAGDARDSVYYYAETAYLWYKNLPAASIFKPLDYAGPEAVIDKVRTFSEKAANGTSRDRWSFVMGKAAWNAVASGNSKNFGAYYRFAGDGNLYVRQVFASSSAGTQGVERGWKVIAIGGVVPQNNDAVLTQINQLLSASTATIQYELPDKSKKTLVLNESDYKTNTIQAAKVFDEGTKKIGYFCFTDFLGDDTASNLDKVFNDFKAKGVNELVIDLRYNGGGYVSLALQLANLIAPLSATGKAMFSYQYNDKLAKLSTTTNFSSSNKLGLSKVVFITTKNSASASELLINSLKPHMDVKIVGSNTHGKPVGFPVIPVMNYVVAPVAFKTVNSTGEAEYYDGFKPDYPEADDLTKNFGDPNELCLKVALEYLKTGKVTASTTKNARIIADEKMELVNDKLPKTFEGMFVEGVDKKEFLNQK
jgi:carboxyl-terminal processing protease